MQSLSEQRRGLDERREQQSPALATAFDPNNPESIGAGFEEFRHFLRMMEGLV
jgi:hypothetical protein